MAFSLDQFYRLNRRALIWIVLVLLLFLMRNFFGLIFLTFILAFIATPLAAFCERHLRLSRRASIIIVYGFFLIGMVSFGRVVVPSVVREGLDLIRNIPDIQRKVVDLKEKISENYPSLDPMITGYMRSVLPEDEVQKVDDELRKLNIPPQVGAAPAGDGHAEQITTTSLRKSAPRAAVTRGARMRKIQQVLVEYWMNYLGDLARKNVNPMIDILWRLSGTMLLALLFSFLITLDIARLREEVESLRHSRLHDFYEQAAQPVLRFAYVLGRSFQAQAVIACINGLLTLIGLLALGIPSLAVLTLIVFICSFIPVLGVFISSTPIVLVALNSGGLSKALMAIALIVVIHMVEAYLLNPIIYGRHLKLNPVLVLLILYIGHHAFGVWGMLLGVPVAYYFIHDVFGVPVWGENRIAPKPTATAPQPAPPAPNRPAGVPRRMPPHDPATTHHAKVEASREQK